MASSTELSRPLITTSINSNDDDSYSMLPRNHASLAKYNRIKSEDLSWTNISVQVKAPNGGKKYILNNISGYVKKGSVLCILGPVCGCGKTTLLNTLCGIQQPTSGNIYYKGKKKKSSKTSIDQMGYDGNAAYIAQDVVLLGSLTVTESLKYAAKLKYLPLRRNAHKSSQDLEEYIADTISYLGLQNCKDTLIGSSSLMNKSNGTKSGQISGGQRKRLSIGIELMSQPTLLFMDEVTSGLDATSAYQIFGIIHRLSQLGHSIIITLHQPSSRLFAMMKEFGYFMMILQRGQTMYFGKAFDSIKYFENVIGCKLPHFMNPIDFYLDVVNDDYVKKEKSKKSMISSTEIHQKYKELQEQNILKEIESINALALKVTKNSLVDESESSDHGKFIFFKQCKILIARNFHNDLRNIGTYWIRVIMYVLLCTCVGSMFFKLGTDIDDQQNRVSILFFIVTFLTFLSIAAIPSFLEQRSLYIRERLNNHYHPLAYSVANFLSSLPWMILIAFIVCMILFFMIQDHGAKDANYFFIFFSNIFVTVMVAESMIVCVSAMSGGQFMIAFAIAGGLMALYIALCGFFLLPKSIPWYWKWVHYVLSFHTYSFQIFMFNDFNNFNQGQIDGNAVLDAYDIGNVDINFNFIVLIVMMLAYRFLFYLLLQFVVKAA